MKDDIVEALAAAAARLNQACIENIPLQLEQVAQKLLEVSVAASFERMQQITELSAIFEALYDAISLLPEEQQDEYGSKIKLWAKREINLSNIIALASLLFTVIFALISMMKDKQIEEYIGRQDLIIHQQGELIETIHQDNENFCKAFDGLKNAIILLGEKFELLNNIAQDTDHVFDREAELEDGDTLNQDADAQE